MPVNREVKIIKVPLSDKERLPDYPKSYAKMHRLYLELLENKAKIKQDLINKEYIQDPQTEHRREDNRLNDHKDGREDKQQDDRRDNNKDGRDDDRLNKQQDDRRDNHKDGREDNRRDKQQDDRRDNHKDGREDNRHDGHKDGRNDDRRDNHKDGREDNRHDKQQDDRRNNHKDGRDDDRRDKLPNDLDEINENIEKQSNPHIGSLSYSRSDSSSDSRSESSSDSRNDSRNDSRSDSRSDSRNESMNSYSDSLGKKDFNDNMEIKEKNKNTSKDTNDSDALSERLKQLLGDTESEKNKSQNDKYSRSIKEPNINKGNKYTPYDKYKQQVVKEPDNNPHPPTLAELEARGHYQCKPELRDINFVGKNDYEEEDNKRELIFKFDLLKKSYPLAAPTIPDYTIHSNLREMQKSYDTTVRKLSLDSSVESYKTYLIGGFMGVEFVFGNFLGFDMQGFTQQQIVTMHSYEKLLIEIGEKSYVPSGSKWPVELRLLFLIIMNAGFFIVSKMIMRKTGANLLNMVNNMNASSTPPRLKRRMQGPKINVDDIPETGEESKV